MNDRIRNIPTRWSRIVGTILLAPLIAISIAGCAVGDPAFLTLQGPETPAVRGRALGRVAIVEPRLGCAFVMRVAAPGPGGVGCINYAKPADRPLLHVDTVVPESARSSLVLEDERSTQEIEGGNGEDRNLPGTISLLRVRCTTGEGRCDSERETLASWPSSYLNDVYHKTIALSPDRHTVALLPDSRLLKLDGYSPVLRAGLRFRTYRMVGDLVVVDVRSGAQRRVQTRVLDSEPISWSADNRRLLFIRIETVDALPPRLAAQVQGNEGLQGTGVPVVETIDVETGATEMIAIGMNAIWSPDQRSLLFESSLDHFELRDLQTGVARELVLPGYVGRYPWIRFVAPRIVMYRALPAAGTVPGYTDHNSPLIGPKQFVTLKVADIDTLQFATVYPQLDPRTNLGYSAVE